MLFAHMDGSGVRGRSQKECVQYVREDLQVAGLSLTWWRRSQDRAGWRAAIEFLLQRTQSEDWKAYYSSPSNPHLQFLQSPCIIMMNGD